jgi:hypothetical protein
MRYVVIKKWKDNPLNFQVIDYFQTLKEAEDYIEKQIARKQFKYEVMVYK